MRTLSEVERLQDIAASNDGKCDRCGRPLKIYKYRVNEGIATVLKQMSRIVRESGENKVNMNDIPEVYAKLSQRTKMRLHGLIAKYKEDGAQVASTWLITKKGSEFLHGNPIPEVVYVFDNQVVGHGDETVTINRLIKEPVMDDIPISTTEARAYKDVRKPKKNMRVEAAYQGRLENERIKKHHIYELEIERLQVGKPVKVVSPIEMEYADIAHFARDWKITKELK